MPWTFRNTTGGNPGVNRELTVEEFDGNTLMAKDSIEDLEGQSGKQIDEITWTGTSITVVYTDATTDGPIPLPVATFNPSGPWLNDTPYAYLDVVTVHGQGIFVCMVAHTSPPTPEEFDPAAGDGNSDSDGEDLLWMQIGEARDTSYDIAFCPMGELPGDTSDGTLLGQFVVIRDIIMEENLSEAEAWLETPSDDHVEIKIEKNGTPVGTIEFEGGANVGTFTFVADVEFARGDRIGIRLMESGATTAGTGADLSVTLPATRTDI